MRSKVIDERRQAGYYPYYKVQWWDQRTVAWRDLQRRFDTPEAAFKHGHRQLPKAQLRVMTINRQTRGIYGREGPSQG